MHKNNNFELWGLLQSKITKKHHWTDKITWKNFKKGEKGEGGGGGDAVEVRTVAKPRLLFPCKYKASQNQDKLNLKSNRSSKISGLNQPPTQLKHQKLRIKSNFNPTEAS